jgi:meso-butanediol dehydrogenase/(S,S)-butanediol dehydrogenase/diacetyl reductase
MELDKRVALVTGGGGARGIGEAVCAKLAAQGALIAVSDVDIAGARSVADRLNTQGFRARAFEHDVASWEDAKRVVRDVEAQLGSIEILVNNAGVSRAVDFLDLEEAEWNRILNINVGGVFLTCKATLPGMVARGKGRVINMSSILGKQGLPRLAAYSASKFAILGLTQSLAAEMARHGITVNAVCPGTIETPLHEGLVKDLLGASDDPSSRKELDASMRSQLPLGRPQTTDDVAEMVAFLVSDRACNITAASFHVDGGLMPR